MDTAEALTTERPRRGIVVPTFAMLLSFYATFALTAATDALAYSA